MGYFENWQGPDIIDARQGLSELGLSRVLELLEKAQIVVLGERPLPTDSSTIEIFPDSLTDEEFEAASDRIDTALAPIEEAFYGHDREIWEALCEYATSHQLKPKD